MADINKKEEAEAKASADEETVKAGHEAEEAEKNDQSSSMPDASEAAETEDRKGTDEADNEHGEKPEDESGTVTSNEAKAEDAEKGKPDKKDKQIEELTDKYKRLFAEFDNFRKRTEQEKAGMYDEGERYVLLKLLPVVDNFERALSSVPEELKGSSYVDGIDKIYRSFTDLLKELHVTPIEAAGQPFDANLHNAVMHIEDDSVGENMIVEEFQKGYMFRDKVLRYSMVKVAN
ncbi:MAG TPA: nucleotide exchange factor GrpE [Candidatus Avilachnospira avistercoris]|nr:nucleotide exchange factor GrpE [Candidatus Avilachnospira avistercoris]